MNKNIIYIICTIIFVGYGDIIAQENDSTKIKNKDIGVLVGVKKIFTMPSPHIEISPIEQSCHNIFITGVKLKDTYLSPNDYIGMSIGYQVTNIKTLELLDFSNRSPKTSIFAYIPSKKIDNWLTLAETSFILANTTNKASNRSMIYFDINLQKSLMYNIGKSRIGSFSLGLGADFNLGAIYNSSNGNNPASLKLHTSIISSALYSYRLPFNSFPVGITMYYTTSLLGATFSPKYGESYYEIFSLQSNGLLHNIYFSSFDNVLNNKLNINFEIPYFDWFNLNIGAFYNGYFSKINQLNTKIETFGISIGLTDYKQQISGRKIYNSSKYQIPL